MCVPQFVTHMHVCMRTKACTHTRHKFCSILTVVYLVRVYGVDGAVHGTIRTVNMTYAAALRTTTHPQISVQKTICSNSTSNAPDCGRMRPKHVELRIQQ